MESPPSSQFFSWTIIETSNTENLQMHFMRSFSEKISARYFQISAFPLSVSFHTKKLASIFRANIGCSTISFWSNHRGILFLIKNSNIALITKRSPVVLRRSIIFINNLSFFDSWNIFINVNKLFFQLF